MEEKNTFAFELLHEVKSASKRWFIIFIITLLALIGTNIGWFIYESQWEYVSEETTQTIEDIDNSADSKFTQQIN